MSNLARNLRSLCAEYRSVSELCRQIGINRQQFARYLSGEAQPSPHNLQRIATRLGVSVEDLLGEAEPLPQQDPSRMQRMLTTAFPGNLRSARALLGYYHSYFLTPYAASQGLVTRALVCLYEAEGLIHSRTIERVVSSDVAPHLSKYDGLLSYLNGTVFVVEFQTLSHDSVVETILYPPFRTRRSMMTGVTVGVTAETHRRPFVAPVAWVFLGKTVELRSQLRQCGRFSLKDTRVPQQVRAYFESYGSQVAFSAKPG